MTINEYLLSTVSVDPKMEKTYDEIDRPKEHRSLNIRPRIMCVDGFTFSAQADWGKYCEPRMTLYPDTWGEGYTSIELGYPSEHEELLEPYAEGDAWTETVYGYVPVEVVDEVIQKHGGILGMDRSNVELPDLPDYLLSAFGKFIGAYKKLCNTRYEEMQKADKADIPESHSCDFNYRYSLRMTKHREWELTRTDFLHDEVIASCSIPNEPDVLKELIGAYIYEETEKWLGWTFTKEEKEKENNL